MSKGGPQQRRCILCAKPIGECTCIKEIPAGRLLDFDKFSDAELEQELARRRAPDIPIRPLAFPDFDGLAKTVIDGVNRSIKARHEDENFKHFVYEAAMTAVYGPDYWPWRRSRQW